MEYEDKIAIHRAFLKPSISKGDCKFFTLRIEKAECDRVDALAEKIGTTRTRLILGAISCTLPMIEKAVAQAEKKTALSTEKE